MAFQIITANQAVPIRRAKGSTVTFVNQDVPGGTDVFLSADRGELMASAPGGAIAGTKIAAGGTSFQWPNFPGVVWARATADTNKLEIIP